MSGNHLRNRNRFRKGSAAVFTSMLACATLIFALGALTVSARAQMVDNTQTNFPNAKACISTAINKSLTQEIGASRGTINTPDSSLFIINRDAFRAVRLRSERDAGRRNDLGLACHSQSGYR